MTIADLIEELKEFPLDSIVLGLNGERKGCDLFEVRTPDLITIPITDKEHPRYGELQTDDDWIVCN